MTATAPSIASARQAFKQLHRSGCFLIPNPWDAGSARYLQTLGFQALATTSSGFAWSHAQADGAMHREQVLAHLRDLVAATDLPVNADFENGFGDTPEAVAESVRMAVATGVAGLSIEDATGNANDPLFDLPTAVSRLRAARQAIDEAGGDVLLVGRAENFFVGRPDLSDTLARASLRPSRCRLPVRSWHPDPRRDGGRGASRRPQTRQFAGGRCHRLHAGRLGRN